MKMVTSFLVMTLALFISTSTSHAAILFHDDFESGDFSSWTQADVGDTAWSVQEADAEHPAYSGNHYARVAGTDGSPASTGILRVKISTVGYEKLIWRIRLSANHELLDSGDFFWIEWSHNGGIDWRWMAGLIGMGDPRPGTPVKWFTDYNYPGWTYTTGQPGLGDNNPNVEFRFRAIFNSAHDQVFLDDVKLFATPEPTSFVMLAVLGFSIITRRTKKNCYQT